MKTIFIYSSFEDFPRWFALDGDYRHLDKFIINSSYGENKSRELNDILFPDNKNDKWDIIPMNDMKDFPHEFDFVINVGFV